MTPLNRLLATLLAFGLAAPARADTPALYPAARFPAGDGVYRAALADVDGDGVPDVLTSNEQADTVTLLRGAGDATFYAPEVVADAERPLGLVAGDLNGDGLADLVVAEADADRLAVMLGLGGGAFAAVHVVAVGETPDPVALGDLDLDGVLDIVVGCRDDGNTSTFLGDGLGGLVHADTEVTGRWPIDIVVADLVDDGWPDVAVANSEDQNVIVLAGRGAGQLDLAAILAPGHAVQGVAVGELSGDAEPDLAVATSPVLVYPATAGALGTPASLPAFGVELAVGDFDGDADADVLASNQPIVLQTAPGQFEAGTGTHPGPSLDGSLVADLDADGALDIIAASSESTTADVTVLRGLGDGSFEAPATITTTFAKDTDMLLADFDLDGKRDLAIAVPGFSNWVEVRAGAGDGTFSDPLVAFELENPRVLVAADANADGWMDLAAVSASFPQLGVALGNGDLTFTPKTPVSLASYAYDATTGDFDGDGTADLAFGSVADSSGSKGAWIYLGLGNGKFAQTSSIPVPTAPDVEAGDLDGDGLTDLVAAHGLDGVSAVLATGGGAFGVVHWMLLPGLSSGLALADFDLDGLLDLLVADDNFWASPVPVKGVRALKGIGDGSFTVTQQMLEDHRVRDAAAADADGDGFADALAAVNIPSRMHAVARGRGDVTFETPQLFGLDHGAHAVLPGDLDGNGRLDVVVSSSSTYEASIVLNQNDGPWTSIGFGLAGSAGVPKLTGSGSLAGGTTATLGLASAAPRAPTWLIAGTSVLDTPFKGGTLVPAPERVIGPLATDAAGTLTIEGTWSGGLPPATPIWFQAWVADAAGPQGFAASHALKALTP